MSDIDIGNIWELREYDRERAASLQAGLGCPEFLAALLVQRGIDSPEEARSFLDPDLENMVSPWAIPAMYTAAGRIQEAVRLQQKTVIYGDYDVDGICSTVLLKECLAELGLEADYYIPDRFTEGYGLNQQAVEELVSRGYKLMITVDCGITACEVVRWAMDNGLDVIVTDHHTPQEDLPPALALINPKLENIPQIYDLAGVGIAFKLAQALLDQGRNESRTDQWLDLAALATVADIVPLTGENRILVKHGLNLMRRSPRTGIAALIKHMDINQGAIDSWHLGYLIAPKLNSAGRLDSARLSVELLLTEDRPQAASTAGLLCDMNEQRRRIEDQIVEEAIIIVENQMDLAENLALVVASEGWHQGVVGIVASRLVDRYNRPVIVISWEDNLGKGSARSIGEFDMHAALHHCREQLVSFGGHRMAAGLHLERDRLDAFRQMLNAYALQERERIPFVRKHRIDLEISGTDIDRSFMEDLKKMQPFGEANPVPQFTIKGGYMSEAGLVGRNKDHLRFRLEPGHLDAIGFNLAGRLEQPAHICRQDFLFRVEENHFNGVSLQLKIKDIKCSHSPDRPYPAAWTGEKGTMMDIVSGTVAALNQRRPVVYVYPTVRALNKHRPIMNHYFREGVVVELHGGQFRADRSGALGMLERRLPRLYVCTWSFWQMEISPRLDGCRDVDCYSWWLAQDRIDQARAEAFIYCVDMVQDELAFHKAGEFSIADGARWVCYANRARTMARIAGQTAPVFKEAGLGSGRARRETRRAFNSSMSGVLITDGSHTAVHEKVAAADCIMMADCPFGSYELAPMLPMNRSMNGLPVYTCYTDRDIEENRLYLSRIYPKREQVDAFWSFLNGQKYSMIEEKESQLLAKFQQWSGFSLKSWEMRPILQVLEDLDLCKCHLQGNMVSISIENVGMAVPDMDKSPLYREGVAEQQALDLWLAVSGSVQPQLARGE